MRWKAQSMRVVRTTLDEPYALLRGGLVPLTSPLCTSKKILKMSFCHPSDACRVEEPRAAEAPSERKQRRKGKVLGTDPSFG